MAGNFEPAGCEALLPARIIFVGQSLFLDANVYQKCLTRARELHHGWDVRFYGASESRRFLGDSWPQLLPVYHELGLIQLRKRLIALSLLSEFGGFVFSAPYFLEAPLESLRARHLILAQNGLLADEEYAEKFGAFAPTERHRWTISNDSIGSTPGHWFLREALQNLIAIAQEQEVLQMDSDAHRHEPTALSLSHAAHHTSFSERETVLPAFPEYLLGGFGSYASRIL